VALRSAALLLAAAAGLSLLAAPLYFRDRAAELRVHGQAGFAVVDLGADRISREAAFAGSDLLYLRQQASLGALLDGVPGAAERFAADFRELCRLKASYDSLLVLDAGGSTVRRVEAGASVANPNRADAPPDAAEAGDFARAIELSRDEVYVSPLVLEAAGGGPDGPTRPTLRLAAPIVDGQGRPRGALVLRFLGRRLLQALDEAATGFSGTLLLLDESGFYLRGARPEDEWGFALGHDRRFDRDHPAAWTAMRDVERGQVRDPSGLLTFRRVRLTRTARAWLADDGLIVAAWVPHSVLHEASSRLRNRLLLAATALLPALLAAAWYVSRSSVQRRAHERLIAASEARLRRLSAELLDAQERERAHLSRDLHDDLGQLSTSVTLDLERARQSEGPRRDLAIERALAGSRLLLSRMHEIAARIRPRILDDLGLRDAVRSHLAAFAERTGIAVETELDLDTAAIPGPVSENAYRILQEALTNVAKHARARSVRVVLRTTADGLCLRVRDDGVGLRARSTSPGLGMLGMRERAELLRGRIVVESQPGAGTSIEVTLPIGAADR